MFDVIKLSLKYYGLRFAEHVVAWVILSPITIPMVILAIVSAIFTALSDFLYHAHRKSLSSEWVNKLFDKTIRAMIGYRHTVVKDLRVAKEARKQ